MDLKQIFFITFLIIILYIIFYYIFRDTSVLTSVVLDGTTSTIINSEALTPSIHGSSSNNYSYSIWFFINDWNYRYGDIKVLFGRMTNTTSSGLTYISDLDDLKPCPVVILDELQNDLIIGVTCFSGTITDDLDNTIVSKTTIENIPIQKWVNIIVSVYSRTLDVYLNGKLVKTTILPGISMVDNSMPVYLTPSGGISGWTSKFQYWNKSLDPQTAWNIYMNGYNKNLFSYIFNGYGFRLSITENNSELNSIQFGS